MTLLLLFQFDVIAVFAIPVFLLQWAGRERQEKVKS
jgi:hypothetical protein